jgi:hypothetical protein
MIRQIQANAKLTDEMHVEAIETTVPFATLQAVVQDYGLTRQRKRQLSAEMGLLLEIGMNLFSDLSMEQVLRKLVQGLRYVWPAADFRPATKGAISQLRYQQGAKPMVDLFHRVCRPLATPATPGAFVQGLRLMGIDGVEDSVADTPENERAFGRYTSGRGEAGFPQEQGVILVEIGTHAIVDAGLWPVHTSERVGAKRLLRSVGPDMLVLWDAGLHSYEMIERTLARGAHFLGCLPAGIHLSGYQALPDGSWLVDLHQTNEKGRRTGAKLRLRLIEYTITDPALPGYGKRRRLLTSLLDPIDFPAQDLVVTYHERWEAELTLDEVDSHQRLPHRPFRSLRPVGLIQEFYGLLIAHYVVRKIMVDAAQLSELDPDRISFTNALHILQQAIPEFQQTDPLQHPALYCRLLRDIASFRLPPRKFRTNPRVVKRKMSNFDKKRPEHRLWPQPSVPFREAFTLTKPYWG